MTSLRDEVNRETDQSLAFVGLLNPIISWDFRLLDSAGFTVFLPLSIRLDYQMTLTVDTPIQIADRIEECAGLTGAEAFVGSNP
jgi:hypothetical protein